MKPFVKHILYPSIHPGLVLLVALLVSFQSLVRIQFQVERELILDENAPVQVIVRMDSGLSSSAQDGVVTAVAGLDGVLGVQMQNPAPEWNGDAALQPMWDELWNTHLSPLLTATVDPEADSMEMVLEEIGVIPNVMDVESNREPDSEWGARDRFLRYQHAYIHGGFLILFLGSVVALVLMFPMRYRRGYAVRTGSSGAGAFINPERIMLFWGALNGVLGWVAYMLIFLIGCLLLPAFPQNPTSVISSILLQGSLTTLVLISAVMIIGWWLPIRELDDVRILHSVPGE